MYVTDNKLVKNIKKLNYFDLLIFLIPLFVFLYFLYIYNPGLMSFDSLDQLHQIATNNFGNWHPFFHTFIEMICIRIYPNPISVCILQILIFSTFWMIICKYNRKDNEFNRQFILQIMFTLFISLIPINAFFSITLWKDVLFSYFLMFLCFLMKVIVDKNGDLDNEFIIILSLVMAFTWMIRANGFITIVLLLIVLGIYFIKKNKPKTFGLIVVATVIFILLFSSLNVAFDVEDNQKDALYVKTTHALSFYDLNVDMDEADQKSVYKLISKKDIEENFNIYFSDPLFYVSNETVYDNNKMTYFGIAIKYSLENPLKCIEYLFESSAMVWDITRNDDWIGSIYYIDMDTSKFYDKFNITPQASYENMTAKNIGTSQFNQLKAYGAYFQDNDVLNILFNSPALYMYMSLILMGAIHLLTKSKKIYFVYLPNLFAILSVFLSTPIQDTRYLYANFLVFYLLVIILIGVKKNFKKASTPV